MFVHFQVAIQEICLPLAFSAHAIPLVVTVNNRNEKVQVNSM